MEEKQQDTEQAVTEETNDTVIETKDDLITIPKLEYDELLKGKEAEKKMMYAYAEFENYKRRQKKELEDKVKFANEQLIKQILPVLDNLILAKDHATKTEDNVQIKNFIQGVEMILKQMGDVLNGFGVEIVQTLGQKFDPYFHEALSQVESEMHEAGVIVDEYQKGYVMNGRLIRPAKVTIAKTK
jgi:molecular chaperone GrpE